MIAMKSLIFSYFSKKIWKRTSKFITVADMLELGLRERKFLLHSLASCSPFIFNLSFSLKLCFSVTLVLDKCATLIPEPVTAFFKGVVFLSASFI